MFKICHELVITVHYIPETGEYMCFVTDDFCLTGKLANSKMNKYKKIIK